MGKQYSEYQIISGNRWGENILLENMDKRIPKLCQEFAKQEKESCTLKGSYP